MSIDIETAARAAFDALHALNSRPRNWDRQPDEDSGEELGRNTFRHMMQAAAGTLPAPEPAVDHSYSSSDPGAGLVPVGVAETEPLPMPMSPGEQRAAEVMDGGEVKVGGGAIVF